METIHCPMINKSRWQDRVNMCLTCQNAKSCPMYDNKKYTIAEIKKLRKMAKLGMGE